MSDLEEVGMQVEFINYPPDGSAVDLRQIALGHQPLILIERELLVLSITASMLGEDAAEVADVLATFAATFKDSVGQSEEGGR